MAVVGVAESDFGRLPGVTARQLHHQAARRALDDAGLSRQDIDGLFTTGGEGMMHPVAMAEYLGLQPRYTDSTGVGGSAWEFHVEHAVAALQAGMCDVALLVYGSTLYTDSGRALGTGQRFTSGRGVAQFEDPFGMGVVARAALAASRHVHEFGTTPEQLAEVAVAIRHNAGLNPLAMHRDPITVADVVGSRLICDPLHKLDCCIVTDGGGAVLLTTEDRARDLRRPPVWVLGTGEAHSHETVAGWPDMTHLAAYESGRLAYARARLGPEDVDVVELYDSYTITVLLQLEALGFCGRGESGGFVEGGRLRVGAALPTCTDGGGMSSNHPGMRGIFLLVEAVRQLRGECGDRQVPGAEVALCNGTGGPMCSTGTVILGRG